MSTKVIADHPPSDGREWDSQCARCGSSMSFQSCDSCDEGDGHDDDEPGEDCEVCDGQGGWWICLSSPEWCDSHPQRGRESVSRGKIEWFAVDA